MEVLNYIYINLLGVIYFFNNFNNLTINACNFSNSTAKISGGNH